MNKNKKYLLTDSCFFWDNKEKRNKHWIEVVDLETGEVKELKSGSVIQIVKERGK